jgi:hypothetical protein
LKSRPEFPSLVLCRLTSSCLAPTGRVEGRNAKSKSAASEAKPEAKPARNLGEKVDCVANSHSFASELPVEESQLAQLSLGSSGASICAVGVLRLVADSAPSAFSPAVQQMHQIASAASEVKDSKRPEPALDSKQQAKPVQSPRTFACAAIVLNLLFVVQLLSLRRIANCHCHRRFRALINVSPLLPRVYPLTR